VNRPDLNSGIASGRVRDRMIERIREQGIRDPDVLQVMAEVPRHLFVDAALSSRAYEDTALPIGHGQTISQPYVVARMAELAAAGSRLRKQMKVLEIGTGCGYAAAVYARLFGEVLSVERLRPLHERARQNLRSLRLANLHLIHGDGRDGLPAEAPFDAIVAAAATAEVPAAWSEQLAADGRIVVPLGDISQHLAVLNRDDNGRLVRTLAEAVRFVPLRAGVQ